jgi:hypothetical protein
MPSPIYAYFNATLDLSLDTTNASLIAGAANEDELFVYFLNKSHVDYPTATITFKRSDGTISPELVMEQTSFVYSGTAFATGTYANSYKFLFYDDWILALKGPLEATIRLYGVNGNVLVSGKLTVNVEASVFSPETTITPTQYTNLVNQINGLATNDNAVKIILKDCQNEDTVQLTVGMPVYASSAIGASGKVRIKRASANYTIPQSNKLLGIVMETINTGGEGDVMILGEVTGVNTATLTAGQPVFVSTTPGQLTSTAPTAPNHRIVVGGVIRADNNGIIYVKQQLGLDVAELCDVQITSVQNGNILRYNSSTLRWENTNALTLAENDIDQAQTDILALDNGKADLSYTNAQLALKANLASPALTGTPLAPTATAGTNTTQLATTAFVGTAVSTLENYTDNELATKVDKTQTIIGIDLQDNILLGEFKTALGNATTSLDGLMSSADKAHLNALVALLETSDSDSVVNTIGEILAIFNNYPEGADLVSALNAKVDKITGKGLSTNDYTDVEKDKVAVANTHALITNGTNPHATTFANITSKPTTISGYGITDAYDKTYVDGLKDFNGWQQTNIATALTNGQTVATTTLTGYDRIMFTCRNTSTNELDTDEIPVASVVNGYKINFFENANINFTFGTTTSTFNTTSGFELRITGALLAPQLAQNINTKETGVNVQTAIDRTNPLDSKIIALNNKSLREVFEGGQLVNNADFNNGTTGWSSINATSTASNGIILNTGNGTSSSPSLRQSLTTYVANTFYSVFRVRVTNANATSIIFSLRGTTTAGSTLNIDQNTPIQNNFYVLSNKATLSGGAGDLQIRIIHSYVDDATANGKVMEVDYAYTFNLTTLGITHLTKAELDEYFALYLKYKQTDNWFADLDVRKANRFIDIPVAELNNKTLREVFVGGNVLQDTKNISKWTSTSANVALTYENDFYKLEQINASSLRILRTSYNLSFLASNLYYNTFKYQKNSLTSYSYTRVEITNSGANNLVTINNTNLNTISTILTTNTSSSGTYQIYEGTSQPIGSASFVSIDNYLIDLTALGLAGLSQARLDFYFNLFKQYETDNGLVAVADALNLLREDNREQDKRLADIEENLRKANSGAITATASGTDIISLGKDTNNAPAQIGVDGGLLQATQLLTNPDFDNGTTGWNANNATLSVSGGEATLTRASSANTGYIAPSTNIPITTNQKFYVNAKVRRTTTPPLNLFIFDKDFNNATFGSGTLMGTINTTYSNISIILTGLTNVNSNIMLYGVSNPTTTDTHTIVFDYIYNINLSPLIANKQYSPLFNTTFDLMTDANIKTQMDLWVSQGVLPNNNIQAVAMNKRVRSVGKNLAGGSLLEVLNNFYIGINTSNYAIITNNNSRIVRFSVIPSTTYVWKDFGTSVSDGGWRYEDKNKNLISGTNASFGLNQFTFTTPANCFFVSLTSGKAQILQPQLEQGSTATTFAPYTDSDAFLQPNTLGYRVPNGVRDTIEFRNGKYYFVQRVKRLVLQESDITEFNNSSFADIDLVYLQQWSDWSYTANSVYFPNYPFKTSGSTADFQNTHYFGNTFFGNLKLTLRTPPDLYASLAAAKTALAGTVIYYQLTTPIETEILSLGIPQSYQGGTIYVDEMMADADLYTTNALISNTAYPIKSLDRIVKINADGSQTELAVSGATIAGDKLSFTHTGLVANDIVWFSYTYDIANTFKSLTTATYYDNPFIAVAPNGTARRLVPSVDNAGVVVWTSVAI